MATVIPIKHGDRPRGHPQLGYAQSSGFDALWHLVAFDTWNHRSFCGRQIDWVEEHASGDLCGTCAQLLDISHSEFG